MSLRDGGKPPEVKPVSFRCPSEIRSYLEWAARARGVDQTQVIIDSIALDRDLEGKLLDLKPRLKAFAEATGLDLRENLAIVLANLVCVGLGAYERACNGTDPSQIY